MAGSPRARLGAIVGVLAALGLLLLVGRLPYGRLGSPGTTSSTPPQTQPVATSPATTPPLGIRHPAFYEGISGLAATGGAVWVAHGSTTSRMDPQTLQETATVTGYRQCKDQPVLGLSAGAGAVWASIGGCGLLRIDPHSARATVRIPVVTTAPAAVGAGGVWVVCCGGNAEGGRLVRIDPVTNRVAATIRLHGGPGAVGAGASGVWVRGVTGKPGHPQVWHIDPATNRVVATIRLRGDLSGDRGGVLVGRDWVWVSNPASFTVYRIDPRHDRLTSDRFEAVGRDLAAAGGLVWVQADGTRLVGLRPGEAARTIFVPESLGSQATVLAAGSQTLWAATDMAVLVRLDLRAVP